MTPEAQQIHEVMNSIDKMSEAQMTSIMLRVDKHIRPTMAIFRELLLNDTVMFERLFAPNFIKKEQNRIIANFLNTNVISVAASPDRDEIMRFSLYIITCEILAKVFEVVKHAGGIGLREFLVIWFILNDKNEFKKVLMDKNIDPDLLDEKIRATFLKEKSEKKDRKDGFREE